MEKESLQLAALIGYTLEETFNVQGSQSDWMGPGAFDGHQIHTWFLLRYLEKTAAEEETRT